MNPFTFLGIAIPVAFIAHVVGRRLAAAGYVTVRRSDLEAFLDWGKETEDILVERSLIAAPTPSPNVYDRLRAALIKEEER